MGEEGKDMGIYAIKPIIKIPKSFEKHISFQRSMKGYYVNGELSKSFAGGKLAKNKAVN
jgi:hypothetical protein